MKKIKLSREACVLLIEKAVQECNKNGYEVIVATDPEGNNYNTINWKQMTYAMEDIKPKYIPIGVWETIQDEIMTDEAIKSIDDMIHGTQTQVRKPELTI